MLFRSQSARRARAEAKDTFVSESSAAVLSNYGLKLSARPIISAARPAQPAAPQLKPSR